MTDILVTEGGCLVTHVFYDERNYFIFGVSEAGFAGWENFNGGTSGGFGEASSAGG